MVENETLTSSLAFTEFKQKKEDCPKASIFFKFFNSGFRSECGHKTKENLTASNAERHLSSFHPYLPVFNNDPSRLLALYASTSSMSLCHAKKIRT
uniref:Uncharacterized protein n=1 Tax=Ditylenchus dipsaci TaxID=166011 RepID=A0A915E238_9BILA